MLEYVFFKTFIFVRPLCYQKFISLQKCRSKRKIHVVSCLTVFVYTATDCFYVLFNLYYHDLSDVATLYLPNHVS